MEVHQNTSFAVIEKNKHIAFNERNNCTDKKYTDKARTQYSTEKYGEVQRQHWYSVSGPTNQE